MYEVQEIEQQRELQILSDCTGYVELERKVNVET